MTARFAKRLLWSLLTLMGTAVLTFILVNAVPGDVARVMAGSKASPQVIKDIHEKLHLDDPFVIRLARYLGQVAQGDLGRSYVTDQSVSQAILTRFPSTLALAATAVVLWMLIAVPVGVLTARLRGGWTDRAVLVLATLSLSLPSFWLARMLQYWISFKLGWLPVAGLKSFSHLVLPATTLAILFVGYHSRLIHANMIEVLDGLFVRAARAKGLPESTVLFRHALRNALVPVITILGMDISSLLGGVMFTENVFALPGIGTLAVQSVLNLDIPMIMGTVLFGAALVLATNLLVDLLYQWIDPRIKSTE